MTVSDAEVIKAQTCEELSLTGFLFCLERGQVLGGIAQFPVTASKHEAFVWLSTARLYQEMAACSTAADLIWWVGALG